MPASQGLAPRRVRLDNGTVILAKESRATPAVTLHLGFGAEFDLADNVMVDANVRFVFVQDPPHTGDFSADWAQFTVGIMFRLSK